MSAEATSPPSGPDLTDEQRAGLEAARCLARAGVPLFVAPPMTSDPSGFGLPKGWQNTRAGEHSLAAVDRWRPGWALCAVMGHVVDLLDVDPRNGGSDSVQALVAEGAWPRDTLATAATPSGGWHAFVPALGVGSRDGVRPGLDVKGGRPDGTGRGFVFLAPTAKRSKVDEIVRAYRWVQAPTDVRLATADEVDGDELDALRAVVRGALERRTSSSSSTGPGEHEAREHTGVIPDGERHAALVSYAGRLRARGLSLDEAEVLYRRRFDDCAQPPAARYPVTWDEAREKLLDVFGRYSPGEASAPAVSPLDLPPAYWPAPGLAGPLAPAVASLEGTSGSAAPLAAAGSPGTPPASWARVDLAPYADGTHRPAVPELLPRPDGVCLLYRGLVHSLHGESESGKSFVAQAEVARVLVETDEACLYVDFESDPAEVVGRLLALGVPAETVVARLDYRRPEASPAALHELEAWADMLSGRYALAVVDGVTDSLGLFGSKSTDNDEVSTWMRRFPRRLARETGAAVVLIDHVTKDADTRGRFAMGAQAKMSGLDGAAYVVDVVEPLGRGLRGVLTLRVAKDRPGTVRGHSGRMRKADRTQEAARFVLDATGEGLVAFLELPQDDAGPDAPFRPTAVMERVSKAVEGSPGVTANGLRALLGGKHDVRAAALELLILEGYVARHTGPNRATTHTIVRPYRAAEDPLEGSPRPGFATFDTPSSTECPPVPPGAPQVPPGGTGSGAPLPPLPIGGRGHRAPASGGGSEDVAPGGHSDGKAFPTATTAPCPCGRQHSAGQLSTCPRGHVWHRFGGGALTACPQCPPPWLGSAGGDAS